MKQQKIVSHVFCLRSSLNSFHVSVPTNHINNHSYNGHLVTMKNFSSILVAIGELFVSCGVFFRHKHEIWSAVSSGKRKGCFFGLAHGKITDMNTTLLRYNRDIKYLGKIRSGFLMFIFFIWNAYKYLMIWLFAVAFTDKVNIFFSGQILLLANQKAYQLY